MKRNEKTPADPELTRRIQELIQFKNGGHNEAEVAAIRLAELDAACRILGVDVVEKLGYQDSGMVDWEHKDRPDAICMYIGACDKTTYVQNMPHSIPAGGKKKARKAKTKSA